MNIMSCPVINPVVADIGGRPTVQAQPERGGYHAATMHIGARFHPGRCKEMSVDHAHQHDHSYTDINDVST